jgi:hypothetical protein
MRRQPLDLLRPTLAGVLVTLLVPVAAAAQTPAKATPLPRFDVAGYVVWIGAHTADLPGDVYRTWDSTGGAAASAGFYLTEHVKLEVDVGAFDERVLFGSFAQESSRDFSRYVYQEHRVASRGLSLTTTYQFLHNTWVHPFVGGGVDIDWERRRTQTEIRTYRSSPTGSSSSVESLPDENARDERVRAAIATGAKFYVSPRVFVRTDVRVSFTDKVDAVRWRAGAGFDF